MNQPTLILIGGFLGAGKTTILIEFAKWLQSQDALVGVITNDQSVGLIDTQRATPFATSIKEVTGGCFCCQLSELSGLLGDWQQNMRPDYIIAEPVGSCTDLTATVILPLRNQFHNLIYAPLTVLCDAKRLLVMFGLEEAKSAFRNTNISYIFDKQLEEAEILVITKSDLIKSTGNQAKLLELLQKKYPDKTIFFTSNRNQDSLIKLFTHIVTQSSSPKALTELDYAKYADGEAALGWYNAAYKICYQDKKFNADVLISVLAVAIQSLMESENLCAVHFKLSFSQGAELAVIQSTQAGMPLTITHSLKQLISEGDINFNIRAEGSAELIAKAVESVMMFFPSKLCYKEAFQPSEPIPEKRLTR